MEKKDCRVQKTITDILSQLRSMDDRLLAIERNTNVAKHLLNRKTTEDDGVDLFASDSEEESEATVKLREERLAAYAEKSKKPTLIAKSNVILDIKPGMTKPI
ncbi:hypothetical protein NQ318_021163 [Aromia moschata]|uniref:Elongation factor 1 beta central acidic region eukaryote domain-containing protein n=1 Tax=Aromia moschata TaxID=1265417 RepID=A0AAV8YHE4_9CUCU|nr:hypothetical protein NQ318_021163 [Aromia moschata]